MRRHAGSGAVDNVRESRLTRLGADAYRSYCDTLMPTTLRILVCLLSLAVAWAGLPCDIRHSLRAADAIPPFESGDGQEADDDEKSGETDVDFSFGASHALFVAPSSRFVVVSPDAGVDHDSRYRQFLIRGPPNS